MKQYIFHVGPYKTGTTFLQKHFFPYLDLYDVGSRRPDLLPFNVEVEGTREWLEEEISKVSIVEEKKILCSVDHLFGLHRYNNRNNFLNTEILKAKFPNAKIIFVTRKQSDMMESMYKNSLHNGKSQSVKEFMLESVRNNLLYAFDWKYYINNYIKHFGKENVLVLPYEEIHEKIFFEKICSFLDVPVYYPVSKLENRSYSWLSGHIALRLNPFIGKRSFVYKKMTGFYKNTSRIKFLKGIVYRMNLRWILQNIIDKIVYVDKKFIDKETRKHIMDIYKET